MRRRLGRALMEARFDFVEQHYRGSLVDVGMGSGAFIELRRARGRQTYGWDVNPIGMEWLDERLLLVDPHLVVTTAITLWDVLNTSRTFNRCSRTCASGYSCRAIHRPRACAAIEALQAG